MFTVFKTISELKVIKMSVIFIHGIAERLATTLDKMTSEK